MNTLEYLGRGYDSFSIPSKRRIGLELQKGQVTKGMRVWRFEGWVYSLVWGLSSEGEPFSALARHSESNFNLPALREAQHRSGVDMSASDDTWVRCDGHSLIFGKVEAGTVVHYTEREVGNIEMDVSQVALHPTGLYVACFSAEIGQVQIFAVKEDGTLRSEWKQPGFTSGVPLQRFKWGGENLLLIAEASMITVLEFSEGMSHHEVHTFKPKSEDVSIVAADLAQPFKLGYVEKDLVGQYAAVVLCQKFHSMDGHKPEPTTFTKDWARTVTSLDFDQGTGGVVFGHVSGKIDVYLSNNLLTPPMFSSDLFNGSETPAVQQVSPLMELKRMFVLQQDRVWFLDFAEEKRAVRDILVGLGYYLIPVILVLAWWYKFIGN